MIKNLNNYVDKKLISIDKSWIIVNSSSKIVKNLKKETEEYANMDVNIKFNNGNIALDYAKEDNNLQIINLLYKKSTLTTLNNKRKSSNNELTNFKKTKLSEFIFDKQEINLTVLQVEPSTNGYTKPRI